MAHNTQYTLNYNDAYGVSWKVELRLKNGPVTPMPYELLGTGVPLKIERRNNDENILPALLQTTCTFQYLIRDQNDPAPAIFFDTAADTWLMVLYRDNSLYWQGYLDGKSNTYVLRPFPYPFQITASDFEFLKGVSSDIDMNGILYYGFVTLGDVFNRVLFTPMGIEGLQVKMLYRNKPAVIGSQLITSAIFTHTDWLYEFNVGAINAYEALEKLILSLGARMLYEDGAYWVQFIQDIPSEQGDYILITPDNTDGVLVPSVSGNSVMGNSIDSNMVYTGFIQQGIINRGLKSQLIKYELKAINQIVNFDWRTNTQSPFDNWEGDVTGFFQRIGDGSASDPYRLRISDFNNSGVRSMWSRIPVNPGQRVQVKMKSKAFINLPAPSTTVYKVFTKAIVLLVQRGTVGTLQQRYLSTGGEWLQGSGSAGGSGENEYYHIQSSGRATDFGTIDILSQPIPALDGVSEYDILIIILDTGIDPAPPPGTTYYTELYPVYAGIFDNVYTGIETQVTNNKEYYLNADPQRLFFVDTLETEYSNAFFYNNGSSFLPLPANNWTGGKGIEEIVIREYMDLQSRQSTSVTGKFISNTVFFKDNVLMKDIDNANGMVVRDNYDTRSGIREALIREILPINSANLTYTFTLTNENNGSN